ncbi:hypothetical protein BU24DRAFT_490664 [Aaosphaeria arxii CBS 175.79]|uniref:Uncharacterized protein n=1 Tax=Aaosphaeria arxii CBS 175.79 TaxID=1450172 RepID=A0A6A5XXQ5_9PLEO|nr:uncharacterized protein BU24DRAFT_490664 [Aaosphaeria arxii CBS 175.79]KAF2017511.1 hypothetical protein BU24DRAFT_490664 [Aaosphaeria arxii CBS 175.79]
MSPAGTAIINSFVGLYQIFMAREAVLVETASFIENSLASVVSKFTPADDRDDVTKGKVAMAFITAGMSLVSAGSITSVYSSFQALNKLGDAAKAVRDFVTVGTNFGTAGLEFVQSRPPPKTNDEYKSLLKDILGAYTDSLKNANSWILGNMTLGDPKSIDLLIPLFNTGLLLEFLSSAENKDNEGDKYNKFMKIATDAGQSLLWGSMLKSAWSVSPRNIRPLIFFIDAKEHKCDGSVPKSLEAFIHPDTAKKSVWCDANGNSWYFLHGHRKTGMPNNPDYSYVLQPIDGANAEVLDGKDGKMGGLKYSDIFISAFTGFKQNGNMNGYVMHYKSGLIGKEDMSIEDTGGLPMIGGLRTPGFFDYPICFDMKEVLETLRNDKSGKAPLCGPKPRYPETIGGGFEANGYAPGICKVFVKQWAKDKKSDNKLDEYQTEIKIYDANGDEAGSAAKDAGDDPRVVVNSLLPYDLIVNTWGNGEKGDNQAMIEFWYSDQWWLSIDQEHKCDFGKWKGRERSGNCFFNCPRPVEGEDPLPSAIANKVPAEPLETAIPGTVTYAPGPLPTPAPAPSSDVFKKGWCTMHVIHHQKVDGHDFEIEVFLFDAEERVVGYTGRAFAQPYKPIPVKPVVGETPYATDLVVWVGDVDKDPISFKYKEKVFNSADGTCKEGKYDHNERRMDCGFTCD